MAFDPSELAAVAKLPNRRVTSDYVAEALRDAINQGVLPDGAVLNQVALAERFGISRVPVREAMKQLQAEGLISAEPHRPAVVRGLSIERIVETYDIRGLVEGYLLEKAAPQIDAAAIKELRRLLREMAKVDDHQRWLELNAEFHERLYEPSGATTGLELAAQLRARGERYVHLWSGGRGIQRISEAAREHKRIVDLVAAGDAAGARREVEQHIAHTRDGLVAQYQARAGSDDEPAP
jgi:DNA-binding GntR family transcriptional regulator